MINYSPIDNRNQHDFELETTIRYEGCQDYIRVYKENGISMVSNDKLSDVANKLKNLFYQSHKSHVVNLEKVVRYHKDGFLELVNGDRVPVARRRRNDIEKALVSWLENREETLPHLANLQ